MIWSTRQATYLHGFSSDLINWPMRLSSSPLRKPYPSSSSKIVKNCDGSVIIPYLQATKWACHYLFHKSLASWVIDRTRYSEQLQHPEYQHFLALVLWDPVPRGWHKECQMRSMHAMGYLTGEVSLGSRLFYGEWACLPQPLVGETMLSSTQTSLKDVHNTGWGTWMKGVRMYQLPVIR